MREIIRKIEESFVKEQSRLAKKTMEQLVKMRKEIEKDPDNRNPKGTFEMYTKKAKRKLDAINWAIHNKLKGSK